MFRIATIAVLLGALSGLALADHLPERSYPVTREMYQRQIEFWNDRADLARLYDLAVTFEGGWRFYDPRALGRLDDRVLKFFDDKIAESNRELNRDLRQGGYYPRPQNEWRYRQQYQYGQVQRVGGRDEMVERRELNQLTQMRAQYAAYRGRYDQGSLGVKWDLVQRLIQMGTQEIRQDQQWLQGQGWQDPMRGVY